MKNKKILGRRLTVIFLTITLTLLLPITIQSEVVSDHWNYYATYDFDLFESNARISAVRVVAHIDGTTVKVDTDLDNAPEYTFTLDEGDMWEMDLPTGTHIWSTEELTVHQYDDYQWDYKEVILPAVRFWDNDYYYGGVISFKLGTNHILITAAYDNTYVAIDWDNDGTPDLTNTLNEGQVWDISAAATTLSGESLPGGRWVGYDTRAGAHIYTTTDNSFTTPGGNVIQVHAYATMQEYFGSAYNVIPTTSLGKEYIFPRVDCHNPLYWDRADKMIFVATMPSTTVNIDKDHDGVTDVTINLANVGDWDYWPHGSIDNAWFHGAYVSANEEILAFYSSPGGGRYWDGFMSQMVPKLSSRSDYWNSNGQYTDARWSTPYIHFFAYEDGTILYRDTNNDGTADFIYNLNFCDGGLEIVASKEGEHFWVDDPDNHHVTMYQRNYYLASDTMSPISYQVKQEEVRFEPLIHGFGFDNYGLEAGCPVYDLADVYNEVSFQLSGVLGPAAVVLVALYTYSEYIHSIGHCYGISRAAIDYYYNPDLIPSGYDTVHDIQTHDESFIVNLVIESYHEFQVLDEDIWTKQIGYFLKLTSLESQIESIKEFIDQGEPALVVMRDPIGGHAVVAYDYEETSNSCSIKFYDSNSHIINHDRTMEFRYDNNGEMYIFNDGDTVFNWQKVLNLDGPAVSWDDIEDHIEGLIKWLKDNLEDLWDELQELKNELGVIWDDFVDWIGEKSKNVWNKIIQFIKHSPTNLHIYDSEGMHVGLSGIGGLDLDFDSLYLIGNELEYCAIPNPASESYTIEIVGTGEGSFNLDIELTVEGIVISNQTISGEIVEDARYVYTISMSGDEIILEAVPNSELEYLKEFFDALPNDYFFKPGLADNIKNALFNKVDEVILKVGAEEYNDSINKLTYDIRAKMDGDSTPKDWIVDSGMQIKLCVIIDHIIASIETLQQT